VTKYYFFLQIDCSQFSRKLLLTTQNLLYWINPTLCHKYLTVQTFVQQCWHVSKFWYSHRPLHSGNNSQIHTGPNCTTNKLFESYLLRPEYPPFCPIHRPCCYTILHSNGGPNTAAVQTTVSCYPCLRLDICKVQVISWLLGGFADHSLINTNLVGRDQSLSDHSEGQHCSSSLSVHSCCLQTEPNWRPPDNPQAQSCLDQQFEFKV